MRSYSENELFSHFLFYPFLLFVTQLSSLWEVTRRPRQYRTEIEWNKEAKMSWSRVSAGNRERKKKKEQNRKKWINVSSRQYHHRKAQVWCSCIFFSLHSRNHVFELLFFSICNFFFPILNWYYCPSFILDMINLHWQWERWKSNIEFIINTYHPLI